MEIDLSLALGGRKFDLRAPQDLRRHFGDEVVRAGQVRYEAGQTAALDQSEAALGAE